jgi:hypothetical protein
MRAIGYRRSAIGEKASSMRGSGRRPAFSLLELEVAFVVFGVALSGLCPLVVMQTRHVKYLEARLSPQTVHYLVPSSNTWAQKLGAAATVTAQAPAAGSPPSAPAPVNQVQILSLNKTLTGQTVTAHVLVQAIN